MAEDEQDAVDEGGQILSLLPPSEMEMDFASYGPVINAQAGNGRC